jgi:hypothetical protein
MSASIDVFVAGGYISLLGFSRTLLPVKKPIACVSGYDMFGGAFMSCLRCRRLGKNFCGIGF